MCVGIFNVVVEGKYFLSIGVHASQFTKRKCDLVSGAPGYPTVKLSDAYRISGAIAVIRQDFALPLDSAVGGKRVKSFTH